MASNTFSKAAPATDLKTFYDPGLNTLKVKFKLTTAGVLDIATAFLNIIIFSSYKIIEKKIESVELERMLTEGKIANYNNPISELEVTVTDVLPAGVLSDSLTISAYESNNGGTNTQIGPATGLVLHILSPPSKPNITLVSKTVTSGTNPYLDTVANVRITLPLLTGGRPLKSYNTFVYSISSNGSTLLKNTLNTPITTSEILNGTIDVPVPQTTITGSAATPLLDGDTIYVYVSVDNTSGFESPLSEPISYNCSLKFTKPQILLVKNAQVFDIGTPRVQLRVFANPSEPWNTLAVWHRISTATGINNPSSFTLAQEYPKTSLSPDLIDLGHVDIEWSYSDTSSTNLKALQVYEIMLVVSIGQSTITSPAATQSNFTTPLKVMAGITKTNHQVFVQSGIISGEQKFVLTYTKPHFPISHKIPGNELYKKVEMRRKDINGNPIEGPPDIYQQLVADSPNTVPSTVTFSLKKNAIPSQFLESDKFNFLNTLYLSLNPIQLEFLNSDQDLKKRIDMISGASLFKYNDFSTSIPISPQITSTLGQPQVSISNVEELQILGIRKFGVSLKSTQQNIDLPNQWFQLDLQISTSINFASGNVTYVYTSETDLQKDYHIVGADPANSATDFQVSTTYYFKVRIYHAWPGASNATLNDPTLLNGQHGQNGKPTNLFAGDYSYFIYTTGPSLPIPSPNVTMTRHRPKSLLLTATQVAGTTTYLSSNDWKAKYISYQPINNLGDPIPGLGRKVPYNDKIAPGSTLPSEIFHLEEKDLDQNVSSIVKVGYTKNDVIVESGSTRPPEIFFEKAPRINGLSYNETSTTIQLIADVDVGVNDNNNNVVAGGAALVGGINTAKSLLVIGLIPAIELGNAVTGTEKYSHTMTYDLATNTYRTPVLTKIPNRDLYGSHLSFAVLAHNNTGSDLETFGKI